MHKQIVKTVCGSDESHPYPVRSFNYRTEQARANDVHRAIVYKTETVMAPYGMVYRDSQEPQQINTSFFSLQSPSPPSLSFGHSGNFHAGTLT